MKYLFVPIITVCFFLTNSLYSQTGMFETLMETLKDKNSYDIIYSVQIGAFKKDHAKGHYDGVEQLFSNSYEDGFTRFFSKLFKSLDEAIAYRDQIRSKYPDAFVLGLDGGFDRILIEVD